MTLSETIRMVEIIASHQPSIRMIVQNDIYRLNFAPSAKYGVFGWLQDQHSGSVRSGMNQFSFTLFYVDRLTTDQGNQIEIQSVGFETLSNIIRELDERGLSVDQFTYQAFNQKFLDECAGGYARVTIEVPADLPCAEVFADYAEEDFSDDFLIY